MESVAFRRPVFVGDVVSFRTRLKQIGTTSITIEVNVEADRSGKTEQLTHGEVTYVAIDMVGGTRRPIPIRDTGADAAE